MKNVKIILGMLILALSSQLYAGIGAGNGGDVVVCRDQSGVILSMELLDFYEGRTLRNILPDLGAPSLSIDEKVNIALNRLNRLDPERTSQYRETLGHFEEKALFLPSGNSLEDIPDSEHISFPQGCQVEQLVIRNIQRFPEDKLYIINSDLWNNPLFNNDQKAGATLHETLYGEAITQMGQHNSIAVRYFNTYICSHSMDLFTLRDYLKFLKEVMFLDYSYLGVDISTLEDISFYDTGEIKDAFFIIHGFLSHSILGHSRDILGIPASFHKNGNLNFVYLFNNDQEVSENNGFIQVSSMRHDFEDSFSSAYYFSDLYLDLDSDIFFRDLYFKRRAPMPKLNRKKYFDSDPFSWRDVRFFTRHNNTLFVSDSGKLFFADRLWLDETGLPIQGQRKDLLRNWDNPIYTIDIESSKKMLQFTDDLQKQSTLIMFNHRQDSRNWLPQLELFIDALNTFSPVSKQIILQKLWGVYIGQAQLNEELYLNLYQAHMDEEKKKLSFWNTVFGPVHPHREDSLLSLISDEELQGEKFLVLYYDNNNGERNFVPMETIRQTLITFLDAGQK